MPCSMQHIIGIVVNYIYSITMHSITTPSLCTFSLPCMSNFFITVCLLFVVSKWVPLRGLSISVCIRTKIYLSLYVCITKIKHAG
jgi:hypothetical protein